MAFIVGKQPFQVACLKAWPELGRESLQLWTEGLRCGSNNTESQGLHFSRLFAVAADATKPPVIMPTAQLVVCVVLVVQCCQILHGLICF